MSFLDVGGVVFGRADGIVAFMRARNVLAKATVQIKKEFIFFFFSFFFWGVCVILADTADLNAT